MVCNEQTNVCHMLLMGENMKEQVSWSYSESAVPVLCLKVDSVDKK